jgi:pimeloyl-ACP methyl ester carboxylesterase
MAQMPPPAVEAADIRETVRHIDLGGRSLAFVFSGAGPVTVLLETGLGAESAEWAPVQAEVAGAARVCRYDRAGRGASEPGPKPRTAAEMVDDLDRLLSKAGISGPYVVVGHSYGGLLMRLFAARHPDEVKGLVLVDSMHPEQFNVFGPTFPPPFPGEPEALTSTRAYWTDGWRRPEATAEGIDMPTSLDQDRAVSALDDLPMRVIHADSMLQNQMTPASVRPMLQQRWNELQSRFLNLSRRASLVHAAGSGHFVHRENPALVAGVIKDLLVEIG